MGKEKRKEKTHRCMDDARGWESNLIHGRILMVALGLRICTWSNRTFLEHWVLDKENKRFAIKDYLEDSLMYMH